MSGSGIGSFGGGFAKGLANAMLSNRERSDQKTKDEQARKDRLFQALLPTYLENVEDPADLEPFLTSQFPDVFGGKKAGAKAKASGTDPMSKLSTFLGPLIGMRGGKTGDKATAGSTPQALPQPVGGTTGGVPMMAGAAMIPAPTAAAGQAQAPLAPPAPPIDPATAPDPAGSPLVNELPNHGPDAAVTAKAPVRRTLLGVPIMSTDEKIGRDADMKAKQTAAMMDRVRTVILPALRAIEPGATLDDALRVAGISIPADHAIGGANYHYGVDREALARSMFGHDFGALKQEEQAAVIDQEKKMLEAESNARGTGAAQAKFNAPVDIPTAQSTGVQVGTTAAQVAGQQVPTQDVQTQRRDLTTLKSDVEHVRTLLGALPSNNDLIGGTAPGAVLAARRRMNTPSTLLKADGTAYTNREAIAALSASVDQVVNALARTRGQQRGAQTERDAERAYNALVSLQAGLLDPFGGDTRESADVRIQQTLEGLDRVLAGLPRAPVAKPGEGQKTPAATTPAKPGAKAAPAAPSAPAAAPAPSTGPQMDKDGNIYINGKKVA